ncbi:MAG: hypothetical protein ABIQ04_02405 [Candidatus Saccharimonadales bacterium]
MSQTNETKPPFQDATEHVNPSFDNARRVEMIFDRLHFQKLLEFVNTVSLKKDLVARR